MSKTSKSPRKVLVFALKAAQQSLPEYSHAFSPKKFTQHQLFACLVLKSFLKTDYRGVVEHLRDCPSLAEAIGLTKVPHFTTLQKAARRLLMRKDVDQLIGSTLKLALGRKKTVKLAAIDSTGLQSRHCSSYYVKRRSRVPDLWQTTTYTRFPKVGIVCDVSNHLILEAQASRGPCPDVADFKKPLERATRLVRIREGVADAGYDSESNHRFAREQLSVRTDIPPNAGRPTNKPASGKYRRQMQIRFNKEKYGQRWQCETVISMIKRRQATATSGRSYWSQCRDLYLMAITHNIMLIYVFTQVFYGADLSLFSPCPRFLAQSSEKINFAVPLSS